MTIEAKTDPPRSPRKVLFVSRTGIGHFLPMVPLAKALIGAGHDVAWASGGGTEALAERDGIRFFTVGPDSLRREERDELFPEIVSLAPDEIRRYFFSRVFTRYEAPLRAPDLTKVVASWNPDVLVHEVAELAAPLVATSAGLPYATHSYGPVIADDVIDAAASEARGLWIGAGLNPHPRAGLWQHLYIDVCPPALQRGVPVGAPVVQGLRPAELGHRKPRRERPLVYVTLGTAYSNAGVFRTILQGLANESLDVLVTIGPRGDPAELGPQPNNVHIERYIPQADVLPECSVMVTHGGAGSTLGAMAFGCPVLFVPQGADQFLNADCVVSAAAGLQILPGELSADSVRSRTRRLLEEPAFEAAARRIKDQIASMPTPREAAVAIERLSASWQSDQS